MNTRGHYDHRRVPASVRALAQWSSHGQSECAVALAFAGQEPGDWRTQALLWLYSLDDRGVEKIAFRLALASEAAARVARIRIRQDIVQAAVVDAMGRVRRDKRVPSARERALQLRIKTQSFFILRDQAERSLRRALISAMTKYVQVCGHAFVETTLRQDIHGHVEPIARAA